mgnify:CR=1 FL=1
MKVCQLIERLQQCSPDAEVFTWFDGARYPLGIDPVDQWEERFVDLNVDCFVGVNADGAVVLRRAAA